GDARAAEPGGSVPSPEIRHRPPGAASARRDGLASTAGAHVIDESLSLPEQVARLERAAIAAALRDCGGNRAQAARRLGIARATLYQKLAAWPDIATDVGADAPVPLSRNEPH